MLLGYFETDEPHAMISARLLLLTAAADTAALQVSHPAQWLLNIWLGCLRQECEELTPLSGVHLFKYVACIVKPLLPGIGLTTHSAP